MDKFLNMVAGLLLSRYESMVNDSVTLLLRCVGGSLLVRFLDNLFSLRLSGLRWLCAAASGGVTGRWWRVPSSPARAVGLRAILCALLLVGATEGWAAERKLPSSPQSIDPALKVDPLLAKNWASLPSGKFRWIGDPNADRAYINFDILKGLFSNNQTYAVIDIDNRKAYESVFPRSRVLKFKAPDGAFSAHIGFNKNTGPDYGSMNLPESYLDPVFRRCGNKHSIKISREEFKKMYPLLRDDDFDRNMNAVEWHLLEGVPLVVECNRKWIITCVKDIQYVERAWCQSLFFGPHYSVRLSFHETLAPYARYIVDDVRTLKVAR